MQAIGIFGDHCCQGGNLEDKEYSERRALRPRQPHQRPRGANLHI